MLMALHRLVSLITPFEDLPSLRLVLGAITTEPVLDVLLAAGLTWAAHSSVAVVLLVMSFAAKGAVPPDAAFALCWAPTSAPRSTRFWRARPGDDPVARRLTIGNLLNRVCGCIVALTLLGRIGRWMVLVEAIPRGPSPTSTPASIWSWLALFLPGSAPYAWLLRRLLPPRVAPTILAAALSGLTRRWNRRRSRWPPPRGRRCAWPTHWRRCWPARQTLWPAPTGGGSPRSDGSTTCWTG